MPVPKLPRKYGNRRSALPANRANASFPARRRAKTPVGPQPPAMRNTPRSRPSGITAKAGCSSCQKAARARAARNAKNRAANQAR